MDFASVGPVGEDDLDGIRQRLRSQAPVVRLERFERKTVQTVDTGICARPKPSLGGQKAEDLPHDPLSLIRLEQELGVGGAINYDQLLGTRSLFELRANSRQPRTRRVRIIARDNKQSRCRQFFRRTVRRGTEQHQTINLARLGFDGCIGGGAAAHASTHYSDGPCAVLAQIAYCGQDVVMERSTQRVRLTRSAGLPVASEIDREDAKPGVGENPRLLLPTLFVELASMSQHNSTSAAAVQVGVNVPTVLSRKRNVLLSRREGCEQDR